MTVHHFTFPTVFITTMHRLWYLLLSFCKGKTLKANEIVETISEEEVLEWCNRNRGGAEVSVASY